MFIRFLQHLLIRHFLSLLYYMFQGTHLYIRIYELYRRAVAVLAILIRAGRRIFCAIYLVGASGRPGHALQLPFLFPNRESLSGEATHLPTRCHLLPPPKKWTSGRSCQLSAFSVFLPFVLRVDTLAAIDLHRLWGRGWAVMHWVEAAPREIGSLFCGAYLSLWGNWRWWSHQSLLFWKLSEDGGGVGRREWAWVAAKGI